MLSRTWGTLALGYCLLRGRAVEADPSAAVDQFRRSARRGNTDAINELGSCYLLGVGVTADRAEAVRWFRRAAEVGDANAEETLQRVGERIDD